MKDFAAHYRRGLWLLMTAAAGLLSLSALSPAHRAEGRPPLPQAGPAEIPPKWVQADWEYYTQGTGKWIADNSAHKSESETWDAYRLEWTWGLGKKTLKGRLLAMKDGKDVGAIFEYLSYWHPKEQRVVLNQWGSDGTYATGTMKATADNKTESVMQFFSPDGSTFQVGHRAEKRQGEAHLQSFNISADGVWEKRRQYVWRPVK